MVVEEEDDDEEEELETRGRKWQGAQKENRNPLR